MEKCFFLPGLYFSIARCMRSFYFSVIFMPLSVNNNPKKKRNWLLLSFFCWHTAAAQTDTLKKIPNGNILLWQYGTMRLLSPGVAEPGSWKENLQHFKKGEKSLTVVRKAPLTGK